MIYTLSFNKEPFITNLRLKFDCDFIRNSKYIIINISTIVNYQDTALARLFISFEFGNGSRMSDKNLLMLEFKYLQNKKW